jgi:hypothetical protein
VVGVSDYAKTFDTYALTLGRNSENIGGSAGDAIIGTEGIARYFSLCGCNKRMDCNRFRFTK